jgi:hypothetical protein
LKKRRTVMATVVPVVRVEVLGFYYDDDGNRVPVIRHKCVRMEGWRDFDVTFGPEGERLFVPREA